MHLIEVDRSGMVLAMWALRKLGCGQDLIEWCSGQRVRGRSWPVVPVKNCKQWIMRWFMNGLRCLDGLGLRWKADAHTEQPLKLCGRVGMCRDLWKLVARAMTPAQVRYQSCEVGVLGLGGWHCSLVSRRLAQVRL